MPRSFFGREKGKIVAVADIGSDSAGVAILKLSRGAPAEMLAATRAMLPFEDRSVEQTMSAVAAQLSASGEKTASLFAQAGARTPISRSYAIIRAPWSRSETAHAGGAFAESAQVSERVIASLAQKALGEITQLDRARIFEASVMRVELNGYPTRSPEGKRARTVLATVLVSDCEPDMRAAAVGTMGRLFPGTPPKLRSGTRALVSALRESRPDLTSYLLAEVEGDATNFVAIRDGAAAEHVHAPEGTRSILKRIAGTGMPEEGLALMRMVSRDMCSTSVCETFAGSLGKVEPDLVRTFAVSLEHLASSRRLPQTMVLVAHEALLQWLARFFARIDFTQFTSTTRPFSVQMLSAEDLRSSVALRAGVTADIGLLVAGALVNTEEDS